MRLDFTVVLPDPRTGRRAAGRVSTASVPNDRHEETNLVSVKAISVTKLATAALLFGAVAIGCAGHNGGAAQSTGTPAVQQSQVAGTAPSWSPLRAMRHPTRRSRAPQPIPARPPPRFHRRTR